ICRSLGSPLVEPHRNRNPSVSGFQCRRPKGCGPGRNSVCAGRCLSCDSQYGAGSAIHTSGSRSSMPSLTFQHLGMIASVDEGLLQQLLGKQELVEVIGQTATTVPQCFKWLLYRVERLNA